jgi:hypothetical protein
VGAGTTRTRAAGFTVEELVEPQILCLQQLRKLKTMKVTTVATTRAIKIATPIKIQK